MQYDMELEKLLNQGYNESMNKAKYIEDKNLAIQAAENAVRSPTQSRKSTIALYFLIACLLVISVRTAREGGSPAPQEGLRSDRLLAR